MESTPNENHKTDEKVVEKIDEKAEEKKVEESKKDEKPKEIVIITEGKTDQEIIDQEVKAIASIWQEDLMILEQQPFNVLKIFMNYHVNKCLDIQITFPEPDPENPDANYPNSSIHLRLLSKVLPIKLVEKILKQCEMQIKKLKNGGEQPPKDGEKAQGQPQAWPIFKFIKTIMENNNLIPAWDEIAQIRGVLRLKQEPEGQKQIVALDEFKMFEKAGKFKIKLFEGQRFLEFELIIPQLYPQQQPILKILGHNFDENFSQMFILRAEQIIGRLHQGGQPGYLPGTKNDMNKGMIGRKNMGVLEYEQSKMKMMSNQELAHDICYLNTAQDLREKVEAGDKKARKYLRLRVKHENQYEDKFAEEEDEMYKLKQLSEGADLNMKTAKQSLFHVVNFLSVYFVRYLPTSKCLGCGKRLVVKFKDPKSMKTNEMRPERSYCGHWMHYKCFDQFVNSPPFLRDCPDKDCDCKKFGSVNFKVDEISVKTREKQYMHQEQQNNEADDIDKLLGI